MSSSKIDVNDTLVLFADLQAGIADLPLTVPLLTLRRGVLALARLAKLFELPVVVSAVPGRAGEPAELLPEIEQGAGTMAIHYRSTADSFDNDAIRDAIEATRRKTFVQYGFPAGFCVAVRRCFPVPLYLLSFFARMY